MAQILVADDECYCPPHCPVADFDVFFEPPLTGAEAFPAQLSVPLIVLPMINGDCGDVVPEIVA